MKRIVIAGILALSMVSAASAAKISLSVDEANLAVQCINLTPVPNVIGAFEPLQLRDKVVTQAKDQITANKDLKTVTLDLNENELNLLLTCIQKAPADNVARAEEPIKLAQKIVTQFNAQTAQTTAAETKEKKKK